MSVDVKKVKPGDLMSVVHFVKVDKVEKSGGHLHVRSIDDGTDFQIQGEDLVKSMESADRYEKIEKLTRALVAEKLIHSHNCPLTVTFEKEGGVERVLRGKLVSAEPIMGRSYCEDFDVTGTPKDRLRLVDHRTIKSLIVGGIKYEVKK